MSSKIKTVGVVGTGTIGASWTALFLANGLKVLVSDPAPGAEEALASHLASFWPTMEELGLAKGASMQNYRFVGASLENHYEDVDFIQENAPERVELKTKLIAEMDAGTRPEVIIASSSSGLPSSSFIGNCKKNPGRVLIGHPFNPPHLMPLVEVVRHPGTDEKVVEEALSFYHSIGKRPVLVKREVPGHAANRLQAALVKEAYSLCANGILSATDIDAAVTTSLGPRWALTGPFMTGVMAGGGGRGGFKHAMEHLVPAMQEWLEDMKARDYQFTDCNAELLDKSVQEQLDHYDPNVVDQQRSQLMIRLLNDKKTASAIV